MGRPHLRSRLRRRWVSRSGRHRAARVHGELQHGVLDGAAVDPGFDPRHQLGCRRVRHRDVPGQAGLRRVDRHDEPVRARGRFGRGGAAHQGRTQRRRHLVDHRQQDLHLVGRPRHGRQRRPPRAGPHARRPSRDQGHLVLHRPQVHGERRRHAGRAQRSQSGVDRAQDGHQRLADVHDELRRPRRRNRLAARQRVRRHAGDVRHDEHGPLVGGRPGSRPGRAHTSGGAGARQRTGAGQGGRHPQRGPHQPDRRPPRRPAHAARHAFDHRGDAGHLPDERRRHGRGQRTFR